MTHLSDFSYLQRDAQEIYLTAFLLIRMWQGDGFKCLSLKRVFKGELRSIVTWFMFLLMATQASWDFLCTYIKYSEGYMQVAPGVIISKPFEDWSVKNQDPIEVMNYIQCVTFSLQVDILLLLQIFWNYLSNTVAKRSFMSSREFTIYIVWTIGTIAMFPILQYFYKKTDLEEVVPQMAYSCEVLIVAILGFRNHTRFNRLIRASIKNSRQNDVYVTDRLTYFRDMNILLSMVLIAFAGSMLILCIDGFTSKRLINSNKFAADLLICNTNVCSIFVWLIIISIFHPSRVTMGGKQSTNDQSEARNMVKAAAPINATSPPPPSTTRYIYNNNKDDDTESICALNQEFKDNNTFGNRSPSPPRTTSDSTLAFGTQQHDGRSNIVSIDDPFARESITFSMIQPTHHSHGVSYASAVDYYGINTNSIRSTTASPPPNQELPPVPGAPSTRQYYY